MSKTKLALTFFCVAFGLNIFAFVLFKSNWVIEENKMVWLYELPVSASPLDSGVATDFGPLQGIQGTLGRQLAEKWSYDAHTKTFSFKLNSALKYQDGTMIESNHFTQAAEWIKSRMKPFAIAPFPQEWILWLNSTYHTPDAQHLEVTFTSPLPASFTPDHFINLVFSHVLTGPIHPSNLEALKNGTKLTKEWISSGPYRVRKWNPKEVIIVSREDYPAGMAPGFFRVLKYQSAPVKNPAAHFLQANIHEPEISKDHSQQEQHLELHAMWICRSWQQPGSICADEQSRKLLTSVLTASVPTAGTLAGQTVRYRIPVGSEIFREKIRDQIKNQVTAAGGVAKEISFFFKNSYDADIELQFISTPTGYGHRFSEMLSLLSGRMNITAQTVPAGLTGEVTVLPQTLQWKGPRSAGQYDIYKKVFLEPDMTDKKLPL